LQVEKSAALVPDAPAKALRLLRNLSGRESLSGVVIVTHGEVMGDVLREVAREDGVKLHHRPPGLKGCTWILEFGDGKLQDARYIPPA